MKIYKTEWGNPLRGTGRCIPFLFILLLSVSQGQTGATHSFSDFSGLRQVSQGTNERDISGSFSNGDFSVGVSGRIMEIPTSGTYSGNMKFRGEHGANNHDWLKLTFSKPVESITFDFPSQDWIWSSSIQESVSADTGSWMGFSNTVGAYDRNAVSDVQTEFTPPAGTSSMGDGEIVVHNTDTQTVPRPYFTTRSASNRFVRPYNIDRTSIAATLTFASPVTEVTLYTDDTHPSGGTGTFYLGGFDATVIPELETFALAAGALAFGFVMVRHRSRGAKLR